MISQVRRVRRAAVELSSTQGGLFTPQQILVKGGPHSIGEVIAALRALHRSEEVTQVTRQVLFHNAHPDSTWTLARAAWMSLNPRLTNIEQLNRWTGGEAPAAVIGGAAAARAWRIDSMVLPDVLFVGNHSIDGEEPRREPRCTVESQDIRWTEDHFPITSVERTIADGLRLDGDWTHIAAALRDGLWDRYALDLDRLQTLVRAVATQDDIRGIDLYEHLLEMAGGLPTQPGLRYGEHRWVRTL
jgi:hypothetical protein